jgi:ribose-phosphate pyrophosphokinase
MVGRGQAVRRGTLDPVFEGSNPSAPTTFIADGRSARARPPRAAEMTSGMRPTGFGDLKLFSGSAHPQLAREIAEFLGTPLGQARLRRFPDSEVSFQIDENIRGTDVFVVQPTCASGAVSVDQHLMELMIMIDAFRRSSAARITAVLPYYGYARQDRKDKPRVPISAKLVANVLSASGTNRVLTMDLHKAQIQGFFDIPVDHLFAAPVIIDYLARQDLPRLTIVAPDAGGAERARAYAKRLGAELAVIDKRHSDDGAAEVMNVIGAVRGRTCVIADDIIDTAGTIHKAAHALKDESAERVFACAVHGVLSGPAIDRIERAPLEKLIVTDTIPIDRSKSKKIVVLSVARLLGQAIRSIHEETSVSSLFV